MTRIKTIKKYGTLYSVGIDGLARYFVLADGQVIYGPALRTECLVQLKEVTNSWNLSIRLMPDVAPVVV